MLSAAIRTRSEGEWKEGVHYGRLEVGREVMNSLTKVAKDTLVIEMYELESVEPDIKVPQEPTTCFHCLRYGRSEEMKRWRRLVGDNGGIKFQGKIAAVRTDGGTNTITNVLKDNLILDIYG